MSPSEFLKALVDDITGKDANGRTADQKRAYMVTLMGLLALGVVVTFFTAGPFAAAVPGALLAYKAFIHFRNTY